MAIFCVRWADGDFSVVSAKDKISACRQLDEWASADLYHIYQMPDFMVNFTLGDDGDLKLDSFGDATWTWILKRFYSKLYKVSCSDLESGTPEWDQAVLKAVEKERTRLVSFPEKVDWPALIAKRKLLHEGRVDSESAAT